MFQRNHFSFSFIFQFLYILNKLFSNILNILDTHINSRGSMFSLFTYLFFFLDTNSTFCGNSGRRSLNGIFYKSLCTHNARLIFHFVSLMILLFGSLLSSITNKYAKSYMNLTLTILLEPIWLLYKIQAILLLLLFCIIIVKFIYSFILLIN